MAQSMKVLATKPGNLRLISRTQNLHGGRRELTAPAKMSSGLLMHTYLIHSHMNAYIIYSHMHALCHSLTHACIYHLLTHACMLFTHSHTCMSFTHMYAYVIHTHTCISHSLTHACICHSLTYKEMNTHGKNFTSFLALLIQSVLQRQRVGNTSLSEYYIRKNA